MEHEAVTDLVTGVVLLLVVASLTQLAAKRLPGIPLTILLVFVGILIAALGDVVPVMTPLASFELTPELVLFVFIPTLIFESAFNLNARQVSRNLWPILALAVPGLLLSTFIIGAMVSVGTDFPFLVALLVGAILSATDPVAVIAIFRQLGVPERLNVLVEGESLFNDATSIVVATILTGLVLAGSGSDISMSATTLEFLSVFIGGVLVGWALALCTGLLLGQVDSDSFVEITATTILAYFSFIIAEHVFHVSGIMAVVAAGVVLGSWGRTKISPSVSEFMAEFWEYLAQLANAMIFLLVGLQMDLQAMWQNAGLIAIVCLAMLVSRALVIFSLVPLAARVSEQIERSYQFVMYWGGLRGAIALALVLALPEFAYKDTLVSIVMGAVLFTLVAQGLTIEMLVRRLRLDRLSKPDELARLEGELKARNDSLHQLDRLVASGFYSARVADSLRSHCELERDTLQEEITALETAMQPAERLSLFILRCLARERARIQELFARGLLGEPAFRELDYTFAVQLEDTRHLAKLPSTRLQDTPLQRLIDTMLRLCERLPGLGRIAERFRTARVIRDYAVNWGRARTATTVLKDLDDLLPGANDQEHATLRNVYEQILAECRRHLDEVAASYPEFVHDTQAQLAQRLLLVTEHDAVLHSIEMGLVPDGVGQGILANQARRLKLLKRNHPAASFAISPEELLGRVALFSGRENAFADIVDMLRLHTFPRDTNIVVQGKPGDSMFLIARGAVAVVRDNTRIATLYAGEFFGESALIHETPRNATVRTVTPCSLYELSHRSMKKLVTRYPDIAAEFTVIDDTRHGIRAAAILKRRVPAFPALQIAVYSGKPFSRPAGERHESRQRRRQ